MDLFFTALFFGSIIFIMWIAMKSKRRDLESSIEKQPDEDPSVLENFIAIEEVPEKVEKIERTARMLKEYEEAKKLAPKLKLCEPPVIEQPTERPEDSVGYPLPSGDSNE